MQISRERRCACGTDLLPTRSHNQATTVVDEGSRRYLLFHCPSCGTLYAAVDGNAVHQQPVGAGA